MPHLSVVSSIYNTGNVLQQLVREILEAVGGITAEYEIVLVDDGSPDGAWSILEALSAADPRIKAVKLTRNFGQHRALAAGLDVCSGEYVVVMDSDLQDQPKEIPRLYEKAREGYPVVIARRGDRMDGWRRRMYSRIFHWLLWKLSGLKTDHTIGNFAVYHRTVVEEVKRMRESDRYLPIIITWAGFRKAVVTVAHETRKKGESGYSFGKLLRLAFSITLSYSDKPLRYAVKAGFVISSISLVFGIYTLVQYLRGKILVLGYTSIILSIWFMGGVILFTLGMAGVYVGRTFEETKRRPRYVIERSIN
ncbi:MAG TPA: glycosyltransferase family 2 protein [Puia sp.]|jgi:dolichol-phosphate mannosyltransferase|nr:glycosyltransferase family 2 protein [Puia sp.]